MTAEDRPQPATSGGEAIRRRPSGPVAAVLMEMSKAEHARYERVLVWRREAAQRAGLAHHEILGNSKAIEIGRAAPETLEALHLQHHLSQDFIARYGRALLEVLRS